HVAQDADGFGNRQRSRLHQPLAQRVSVDERHRVIRKAVRFPGAQDPDDVRMLQLRRELNLALEALHTDALAELRRQDLDDHFAAEGALGGHEDTGHPPTAQLALEAIVAGRCLLQLLAEIGRYGHAAPMASGGERGRSGRESPNMRLCADASQHHARPRSTSHAPDACSLALHPRSTNIVASDSASDAGPASRRTAGRFSRANFASRPRPSATCRTLTTSAAYGSVKPYRCSCSAVNARATSEARVFGVSGTSSSCPCPLYRIRANQVRFANAVGICVARSSSARPRSASAHFSSGCITLVMASRRSGVI